MHVRAGLVKDMNWLSVYPWSGHSVIMGKIGREWQDTDSVLSYFGDERKNCVERYEKFVLDGIKEGKNQIWSAVLSLRRKGRRLAYDERILGNSEFVQRLLSEAEKKEKQSLRLTAKIPDLAFLAVQIAKGEGIDKALLLPTGRQVAQVPERG